MYNFIIVALLSSVLSGFGTWKVQAWRYDSKELARSEAAAELTKLNARAASIASAGHEEFKTKTDTKYLVVTSEIENVVTKIEYRDRICFDADGMRAHDGAVRLTGAAPKPENSVSTPAVP
jgi:hypothetical protein